MNSLHATSAHPHALTYRELQALRRQQESRIIRRLKLLVILGVMALIAMLVGI
jgi:hypothetical protein